MASFLISCLEQLYHILSVINFINILTIKTSAMENSTTNEAPPKTPSTEPSAEPEEEIEYEDMSRIEGIEHVERYNKGGYHPVHIGEILDNRFEVVHRLGSGGFGIVWLCRDLKLDKWRAVKVLAADSSSGCTEKKIYDRLLSRYTREELDENHITLPLEEFWIEGPNGLHLCFVMPVHGSVLDWRMLQKGWKEETNVKARSVCSQIIKGMRLLHHEGICHGDLKPHNILVKLEGVDDLDKEQILKLMDLPEVYDIETVSGQPPAPRAPEYCVVRTSGYWCEKMFTDTITIVDFGESFFIDNPPETTGIPTLYAPPEIMFEGSGIPGLYSDIWSLACTIFEIRTNEALLFSFYGGSSLPISELKFYIGLLPPVYQKAYCEMLREMLPPRAARQEPSVPDHRDEDKVDENEVDKDEDEDEDDGEEYEEDEEENIYEVKLKRERDEYTKGSGYSDVLEARLGKGRQVYREYQKPEDLPPDDGSDVVKWQYSRKEVLELTDLLRKMLKYNPSERIDIDAVISHPWVEESQGHEHSRSWIEGTIFGWTLPSCTIM